MGTSYHWFSLDTKRDIQYDERLGFFTTYAPFLLNLLLVCLIFYFVFMRDYSRLKPYQQCILFYEIKLYTLYNKTETESTTYNNIGFPLHLRDLHKFL